ncbi:S10 family peptidase [Brevundimonas sp. SORGH_AS_0993]|uniref:S10 family peptidase n=1 Tax=Brevundimonas sp. SORGH_AS_0993 TaxID=3041794 RepID=UPI00277EA6F7|nr:peptidase S10 [Brevundimonas sp. SORGH_AS_0993]MDQ1155520.1 carboxypeptidase C (cathepsin A) [Brevundimonas sp. SORGH_AS_0993]
MRHWLILSAVAAFLLGAAPVLADEPGAVCAPVTTRHEITIRGQRIAYTATAGATLLRNDRDAPIASLYSFAYVKTGGDRDRPVLFVFNGGPGASSLWLHMGVVGPRRVRLDQEVNPSSVPPFGLVDNPDSLLDVADLVFIDPVGTGFSRIVGEGRPENFYGVDEDAESVAQFIELWLTRNGRWNAPKYLMGESYGSARAALLPRALMGGPTYGGVMRGVTVNGIILLGASLNGPGTAGQGPSQEAALNLPAMAATAWVHDKIDHRGLTIQAFDDEVTRFATTDYLQALDKAAAGTMDDAARAAMAARLSAYTGLPAQAWLPGLVVSPRAFSQQLLADQGLTVGLYDGRYTLPSAHDGGEPVADDPAMGRYVPGFIAAFHQMLGEDLNVHEDRSYGAIVWRNLLPAWNWKRTGVPEGQSFAGDLATAMRRNGDLRVLVASGYYDMVTTPAAAHDALIKAGVPMDRLTLKTYESGHMLYLGNTAAAFSDDVRALIRSGRR